MNEYHEKLLTADNSSAWRKQHAAIGRSLNSPNNEYVGDVQVYKTPLNSSSELVLTLYQLKLG